MFDRLAEGAIALGATRASVIDASLIKTDTCFRDMCAANACGMYGKCYMCPPDVGEIAALMASLRDYDYALVYQTVSELEDSYDFEGMVDAKNALRKLSQALRAEFPKEGISRVLHLGAGGCGVCKACEDENRVS